MRRSLLGLALGVIAAGATYADTGSSYWTWLAGFVAAASVWTWPLIRDELTNQT